MTCGLCWRDDLKQTLDQLRREVELPPRVAVLGLGHELRQDDAAGLLVAQALRPFNSDTFFAVVGGAAPENCSGQLTDFAPHLLVVVDAAKLDAPPGTVQVLNWRAATGFSGSSHTLPLRIVLQYITAVAPCRVLLLGIRPQHLGFGTAVSPAVQQAVMDITIELTRVAAPLEYTPDS